jgi:hypothetical protein
MGLELAELIDETGAMLEHPSEIPQTSCTGNRGFKLQI